MRGSGAENSGGRDTYERLELFERFDSFDHVDYSDGFDWNKGDSSVSQLGAELYIS